MTFNFKFKTDKFKMTKVITKLLALENNDYSRQNRWQVLLSPKTGNKRTPHILLIMKNKFVKLYLS